MGFGVLAHRWALLDYDDDIKIGCDPDESAIRRVGRGQAHRVSTSDAVGLAVPGAQPSLLSAAVREAMGT
jgi:hypothetical protein